MAPPKKLWVITYDLVLSIPRDGNGPVYLKQVPAVAYTNKDRDKLWKSLKQNEHTRNMKEHTYLLGNGRER